MNFFIIGLIIGAIMTYFVLDDYFKTQMKDYAESLLERTNNEKNKKN